MAQQIEGIPAGWEAVGWRKVKCGEYSIDNGDGKPRAWTYDSDLCQLGRNSPSKPENTTNKKTEGP